MTRLFDLLTPAPDSAQVASGARIRRLPAEAHLAAVRDKRVLVTGAGGSIGSALSRAVAACSPQRLVLLDSSEHGLYQVGRELRADASRAEPVLALGSVGDPVLLSDLFARHKPQIVFHAAAYKHVSLLEEHPLEAVANNACNTWLLAQTARLHRAERLVLISTDKAVDPTSVMGATKRAAELTVMAMSTDLTRMSAVRLGNVFGSRGSVVPLFREQIARGGPVTVTHPDASRYFMTTNEAVEALLGATACDSASAILVPELGAPVRIHDLARGLIAQSSDRHIAIKITGLGPGEKLEESLIGAAERWLPGESFGLRGVHSLAPNLMEIDAAMRKLSQAVHQRDETAAMEILRRLVPEYRPSSLQAGRIAAASFPGEVRA